VSSLPAESFLSYKVRPFSVCSSDTLLACALRAWANFSDCGFSRRVFLFRQEFSFSQSYRFFIPSFCQALAEDRVTTPTKKKKNLTVLDVLRSDIAVLDIRRPEQDKYYIKRSIFSAC